jgi:hypothetical protein
MAMIRTDTVTGITGRGEKITMPVEVHDCSGINNEEMFRATNVARGDPNFGLRNQQAAKDQQTYPDSTFTPHDMPSPKPPKAGGAE